MTTLFTTEQIKSMIAKLTGLDPQQEGYVQYKAQLASLKHLLAAHKLGVYVYVQVKAGNHAGQDVAYACQSHARHITAAGY